MVKESQLPLKWYTFQFLECFKKLRHPPKNTRTHFDINETMQYPALTFCRDPPYKIDVLKVSTLKCKSFNT